METLSSKLNMDLVNNMLEFYLHYLMFQLLSLHLLVYMEIEFVSVLILLFGCYYIKITDWCLLLIYYDLILSIYWFLDCLWILSFALTFLWICYEFFSAIFISSIPLEIKAEGIAFGLLGVMLNTASALFSLITGKIHNTYHINEIDPFQG